MYNKTTDNFIFACIFASVVVMAIGDPLLEDGELKDTLSSVEWFCTMVFTFEAVLRIIALEGFSPYISDSWNQASREECYALDLL